MQPILLDRFRDIIRLQGSGAVMTPETRIDASGRHAVFYIPFEHVNPKAQIVIVGITPGPNQLLAAYAAAQRAIRAGRDDAAVLAEAKCAGAFEGSMRTNLVRLLDAYGFPHLLGIASCASLWGMDSRLLHATSVVPHAAFRTGAKVKKFAGSFEDVLGSPALRRGFEEHFLPSLGTLPRTVRYLALGPTALEALRWCAERRHLDERQILGALPHPSGESGSQVRVFLGEKRPEDLKPKDPVRNRLKWLLPQMQALRAAVEEACKPAQAIAA